MTVAIFYYYYMYRWFITVVNFIMGGINKRAEVNVTMVRQKLGSSLHEERRQIIACLGTYLYADAWMSSNYYGCYYVASLCEGRAGYALCC